MRGKILENYYFPLLSFYSDIILGLVCKCLSVWGPCMYAFKMEPHKVKWSWHDLLMKVDRTPTELTSCDSCAHVGDVSCGSMSRECTRLFLYIVHRVAWRRQWGILVVGYKQFAVAAGSKWATLTLVQQLAALGHNWVWGSWWREVRNVCHMYTCTHTFLLYLWNQRMVLRGEICFVLRCFRPL